MSNPDPTMLFMTGSARRAFAVLLALFVTCPAAAQTVRMNAIQVIGSHNSYKLFIDAPLAARMDAVSPGSPRGLEYTHIPIGRQLDMGLRNLELDVLADPEGGRYARPLGHQMMLDEGAPGLNPYDPNGSMQVPGFKVLHMQDVDFRSTCLTFVACAEHIRAWSLAHPDHVPIAVTMNAKQGESVMEGGAVAPTFTPELFRALENELLSVFSREHLLTPDDVRGGAKSLEAAILGSGWPALDSTRGKVLFVLDEGGETRRAYTDGDPLLRGRLLFGDFEEGHPSAAFRIVNDPVGQGTYIRDLVERGYMVRTRADAGTEEARTGNYQRFEAALASGAQYITTDYYLPNPAFGTGYRVGLPARHEVTSGLQLSGTVAPGEAPRHEKHAFEVPEGTEQLQIMFSWTGSEAGNQVEIGLEDPHGIRGASRFSKQAFSIGLHQTSTSYVAGPVAPGTWHVLLAFSSVVDTARWQVDVRFDAPSETVAERVLSREERWYAGDWHTHTGHSDGYGCRFPDGSGGRGCHVMDVARLASERGLDFVAVTDHNTVSHHQDVFVAQESFNRLLLLRGQEVTSFYGHANVYGTSRAADFTWGTSLAEQMEQDARTGAVWSLNHPGRASGATCTGCGWTLPDTPWDRVEVLEIINSGDLGAPDSGIPFWHERLNAGYRIIGIGGSDDHGASGVGRPTTMVRSSGLSEAALLAALRRGDVYVKPGGPEDPDLSFRAESGNGMYHMGSTIPVVAAGDSLTLHLSVHTAGQPNVDVEWIGGAPTLVARRTTETGTHLTWRWYPGTASWIRFNVRVDGEITAVGNPLFIGPRLR